MKRPMRRPFLRRTTALRIFGLIVILAAVASAGGSFLILTGLTDIEPSPDVWAIIWIVNAALVLLVVALVLTELILLIRSRMQKQAGSGLHTRLVGWFAVAAVVPALIVAVIATIALNQGLDQWFSERTRTMVEPARGTMAPSSIAPPSIESTEIGESRVAAPERVSHTMPSSCTTP